MTTGFSLDVILGVFAAGVVVGLVAHGRAGGVLRARLDAIGLGVHVSIVVVTSGIDPYLNALFAKTPAVVRLPVLRGLHLLVRGLPALVIVAVTEIGFVEHGR